MPCSTPGDASHGRGTRSAGVRRAPVEINRSLWSDTQVVGEAVQLERRAAARMHAFARCGLHGIDSPRPFHLVAPAHEGAAADGIDPAAPAVLLGELVRDAVLLKPGVQGDRAPGPGLQELVYLHARKAIHSSYYCMFINYRVEIVRSPADMRTLNRRTYRIPNRRQARIALGGAGEHPSVLTNEGLSRRELAAALQEIGRNRELLLQRWREIHGDA